MSDAARAFWSACRSGDLRGVNQALSSMSSGSAGSFSLSTQDLKDRGRTALHKAASSTSAQCVRILLERGLNPNQDDNDGNTPLHLACLFGRGETVEALLSYGADASLRNGKQQTAMCVVLANIACLRSCEFEILIPTNPIIDFHSDIATYKSNASIKALLKKTTAAARAKSLGEGKDKGKRQDNLSVGPGDIGRAEQAKALPRASLPIVKFLSRSSATLQWTSNEGFLLRVSPGKLAFEYELSYAPTFQPWWSTVSVVGRRAHTLEGLATGVAYVARVRARMVKLGGGGGGGGEHGVSSGGSAGGRTSESADDEKAKNAKARAAIMTTMAATTAGGNGGRARGREGGLTSGGDINSITPVTPWGPYSGNSPPFTPAHGVQGPRSLDGIRHGGGGSFKGAGVGGGIAGKGRPTAASSFSVGDLDLQPSSNASHANASTKYPHHVRNSVGSAATAAIAAAVADAAAAASATDALRLALAAAERRCASLVQARAEAEEQAKYWKNIREREEEMLRETQRRQNELLRDFGDRLMVGESVGSSGDREKGEEKGGSGEDAESGSGGNEAAKDSSSSPSQSQSPSSSSSSSSSSALDAKKTDEEVDAELSKLLREILAYDDEYSAVIQGGHEDGAEEQEEEEEERTAGKGEGGEREREGEAADDKGSAEAAKDKPRLKRAGSSRTGPRAAALADLTERSRIMLEGFKRFDRAAVEAGRRAAAAEAWAEEMRRQRDAAESRMREVVGGLATARRRLGHHGAAAALPLESAAVGGDAKEKAREIKGREDTMEQEEAEATEKEEKERAPALWVNRLLSLLEEQHATIAPFAASAKAVEEERREMQEER